MSFQIPQFPHLSYGTLFCIGRNYHDHIKEMNSRPTKDPVVFLKPRSSIIHQHETIQIPPESTDVHHEVELVLLIGKKTHRIPSTDALASVAAFTVGIDLTARDLQSQAKENGLPWTLSKGFDTFAPVGSFVPFDPAVHNFEDMGLRLRVNGDLRQSDPTSLMIFPPAELISYLSHRFTLYPGDLIFTGTPKGVAQLQPGDIVEAELFKSGGDEHLSVLHHTVEDGKAF